MCFGVDLAGLGLSLDEGPLGLGLRLGPQALTQLGGLRVCLGRDLGRRLFCRLDDGRDALAGVLNGDVVASRNELLNLLLETSDLTREPLQLVLDAFG